MILCLRNAALATIVSMLVSQVAAAEVPDSRPLAISSTSIATAAARMSPREPALRWQPLEAKQEQTGAAPSRPFFKSAKGMAAITT